MKDQIKMKNSQNEETCIMIDKTTLEEVPTYKPKNIQVSDLSDFNENYLQVEAEFRESRASYKRERSFLSVEPSSTKYGTS